MLEKETAPNKLSHNSGLKKSGLMSLLFYLRGNFAYNTVISPNFPV